MIVVTHNWGNENASMKTMKYVQDFLFKISMGDQYFRWKGKTNQ